MASITIILSRRISSTKRSDEGYVCQFPLKQFAIKNVLSDDGDLVSTHLHSVLKSDAIEFRVFHLFRFNNEKIVEFWDCAQEIKPDSPNIDGTF